MAEKRSNCERPPVRAGAILAHAGCASIAAGGCLSVLATLRDCVPMVSYVDGVFAAAKASAQTKPLAQAHWKLYPPSQPVTSTASPMA